MTAALAILLSCSKVHFGNFENILKTCLQRPYVLSIEAESKNSKSRWWNQSQSLGKELGLLTWHVFLSVFLNDPGTATPEL